MVREALASEYDVTAELGRGGMAIVYRAVELSLEREVAIKVLPASMAFDTEFVQRFQNEARTAAGLEHPHIIPVYRVGRAGNTIYFVMKFLRGGSLSDLLVRRGRLGAPEIRRLLMDTGTALGHAAQRGTVHRDIKPDNILFDEFGVSAVTDFGIAKAARGHRLTGTGMSIGTPHYMSPEQARAQQTDGRSDLYSLGVVAYQCLSGRVPFDGEDGFAIGYQHIMEPLPEPVLSDPDERRLFVIIRRLLSKEPAGRYADANAMVAALSTGPVTAVRLDGPRIRPLRLPGDGGAIVSPNAPTTPVPAASAARASGASRTFVSGSSDRIATPRPVARRPGPAPGAGLAMLAILIVLGGAGMWYYFRVMPGTRSTGANGTMPVPVQGGGDSVIQAAMPVESDSADSAAVGSVTADPGATTPPPRQSTPSRTQTPAGVPRDTGRLRITGLPRGSTVLVNGLPIMTAVTPLPAGRHTVAISAPRNEFWTDTVTIVASEEMHLRPNLTPLGERRRPKRLP